MITYRVMENKDIPAGLALCRYAGWNQVAGDWELFLQLSPDGCRVAVNDDGDVVGTVTTVSYQKHFSWIGMVLVDPQERRKGIGTGLLQEALQILQHEETIKLDASPAGREVYLPLGFVDEYSLSRFQLHSLNINEFSKSNAIPLQPGDIDGLRQFDKKVFGADRSLILERLLKNAPDLAFITKDKNQINGFCFGRRGHDFIHIGPVIAMNISYAIQLVSAVLKNCAGHPIILDVPHHTNEWNTWLNQIGFKKQRPFVRMYRGKNNSTGVIDNQFAILGPEFG